MNYSVIVRVTIQLRDQPVRTDGDHPSRDHSACGILVKKQAALRSVYSNSPGLFVLKCAITVEISTNCPADTVGDSSISVRAALVAPATIAEPHFTSLAATGSFLASAVVVKIVSDGRGLGTAISTGRNLRGLKQVRRDHDHGTVSGPCADLYIWIVSSVHPPAKSRQVLRDTYITYTVAIRPP